MPATTRLTRSSWVVVAQRLGPGAVLGVVVRGLDGDVQPGDRRDGEQDDTGEEEEQERLEQEAEDELLQGDDVEAPVDALDPAPVRHHRPVEDGRDLDDPGPQHLGLVDDLGVDVDVDGLQVERAHEGSVVGAHEPGQRAQAVESGHPQEAVGRPREEQAPARDAARLATLHVGRRDHDAGVGRLDGVEQGGDVADVVGQVGVEGDEVVAPGLGDAVPERLPEAEVGGVAEHPDVGEGGLRPADDIDGGVGAAVVDHQDLEVEAVRERGDVGLDRLE